MPTPPTIPAAMLAMATAELYERTDLSMETCESIATGALTAALAAQFGHLLVATEDGVNPVIWAHSVDHPDRPTPMLARTQENAPLFDVVAALLAQEKE